MVIGIQIASGHHNKGEILNFMFKPRNIDVREALEQSKFLENIKSKLYTDKGYIDQTLFKNFS